MNAPNHPKDSTFGERKLPITKEIYIERSDFMEEPPKKFHRLSPGKKVRLRYAFVIRCEKIVKDENGIVQEVYCSYDPSTYNGKNPDDGKVKGIIHWVSAEENTPIQVRLFDRLFSIANPNGEEDFRRFLNPKSLEVKNNAIAEIGLKLSKYSQFQFERTGYFSLDKEDSTNEKLVYNSFISSHLLRSSI